MLQLRFNQGVTEVYCKSTDEKPLPSYFNPGRVSFLYEIDTQKCYIGDLEADEWVAQN